MDWCGGRKNPAPVFYYTPIHDVFITHIIHFIITTKMDSKKIVSIRLEPDTIKWLDRYCSSKPYMTRSLFISNLLNTLSSCADYSTIFRLTQTYQPYSKGLVVKAEISEEVREQRLLTDDSI